MTTGTELLGQAAEFERILRGARALQMHHGLLIEGPAGSGKSLAVRAVAAALLCTGDDMARACGVCDGCIKVAAEEHADLHFVTPPEGKRVIPVDAIRSIRSTLGLTAVEDRARVVVIDPGDDLQEQGQNALLKTLEEPGENTFLLLTARRPEGLLPTVRSRVSRYRMRPLDPVDLRAVCSDLAATMSPDELDRVFAASGGYVGTARALCGPTAQRLEGVLATLLTGKSSPVAAAQEALEGAGEGRPAAVEHAKTVLRWCSARCRAGLRADHEPSLAPDRGAPYAPGRSPWLIASEAVFAAEEDLAVEIPIPQVLTELFLRWTDALVGGGPLAGGGARTSS